MDRLHLFDSFINAAYPSLFTSGQFGVEILNSELYHPHRILRGFTMQYPKRFDLSGLEMHALVRLC